MSENSGRRRHVVVEGDTFGRLTVIGPKVMEFAHGRNRAHYPCACQCGAVEQIKSDDLVSGRVVSCGCLQRDNLVARNTKHGMSRKGPYVVWCGMRDRCSNPNHRSYPRYGGRGISVCEAWNHDYLPFHEWAINSGYSPDLTLERIDNDKGYNPDNCTWITHREQTRNKSSNIYIEAFGERKLLTEWMNDPRCGVKTRLTIKHRMADGWAAEQAISVKSSTCIGHPRNR